MLRARRQSSRRCLAEQSARLESGESRRSDSVQPARSTRAGSSASRGIQGQAGGQDLAALEEQQRLAVESHIQTLFAQLTLGLVNTVQRA